MWAVYRRLDSTSCDLVPSVSKPFESMQQVQYWLLGVHIYGNAQSNVLECTELSSRYLFHLITWLRSHTWRWFCRTWNYRDVFLGESSFYLVLGIIIGLSAPLAERPWLVRMNYDTYKMWGASAMGPVLNKCYVMKEGPRLSKQIGGWAQEAHLKMGNIENERGRSGDWHIYLTL